jgi:hypothetical protein
MKRNKMENPPRVQDRKLRDLLATETKRQQRAYRRATLFVCLVALLGAAWLAFSVFNVIKLERRGATAQAHFAELQRQSA